MRTSDFGTLANLDYTIDGIGRVTRLETMTHRAGTVSGPELESRTFNYFYDGMRRLRTANGPLSGSATTTQILQYRYDPIGNLREIESVPVDHAHPEKPHWPSAKNGLPIEADPEGAIASRTVGAAVQAFTHDSLGRPRQTGNLVHGYDWTSRRVRTWQTGTPTNEAIIEPEPGYSYENGLVNKHFFVAGRRVAASAKSWTAPSASAPVLWAPDWPRLPLPPPWAWGLAYAGALGGLLVLARRRRGYGGASPGLRFASVAVLATVAPTLIVGCPPSGKRFGSFGDAALFFVTDAVGSTILAVRPDGSVRNRFLYRPYGEKIVNEGAGSPAMPLAHGFAGGAVLLIGPGSALYAFGPRLYDPSIGHFYQPDPLLGDPAAPQTMQPYGYALGDPLRLADPTGLFSEGGPVSSPPSFGLPSFRRPSGNGKGRVKPVNTASNVPPAPTMGFQEGQAQPDTLPRDSDGRTLFDLRSLAELLADFNEVAGDLRRLEGLREMQEAELRDRLAALESAFEPGALVRRFGGPFIAERGGLLGAAVEATVLTGINIFEFNQEVAALRGAVETASSKLQITKFKLLQARRRVDNLGRIIDSRRMAPHR